PITIDITLVVDRFIWLAAIIESDRIGPDVLLSLTNLLPVVLPVHSVPVEIVVDTVFEACPDRRTRISGWSVDHDRTGGGPAAVINPIFATAPTFLIATSNVVPKLTGIPYVNCTSQLVNRPICPKSTTRFSRPGI